MCVCYVCSVWSEIKNTAATCNYTQESHKLIRAMFEIYLHSNNRTSESQFSHSSYKFINYETITCHLCLWCCLSSRCSHKNILFQCEFQCLLLWKKKILRWLMLVSEWVCVSWACTASATVDSTSFRGVFFFFFWIAKSVVELSSAVLNYFSDQIMH